MSNVKLAIRVRPFTERELKVEKDSVPVVSVVDDHTVTITNVKVSASGAGDSRERVRSYNADYTLDSSCPPTHPGYASQDKVFETIGRDVLASITRGLSACVLAYGQSATGKTHTMMGTEAKPGLVPRICTAMAEELMEFAVTVSFLEIYNERVHDLLAGEEAPPDCNSLPRRRGNARKDLRVREHPERGPYVQNLRRVLVHDVHSLLSLVREGAGRRRTASTRRNLASSRSHALLELTTRGATLHLADLAGSEKASWEGCGGGRQKEGANINKSLVALSNVISALVHTCPRSSRGRFVPYRDSALTWLLKDCFLAGAATFIIATVSPSVACYGESASTLRWSARARQLPPRAPRPPAAGSALQAQLNLLLAELARHHIRYIPEIGKISYDDDHWNLSMNTKKIDKTTEIENKMNPSSIKPDNQNSESTASSVASGSSDVINTMDKKQSSNLSNVISKEMDELFGPSLERTKSGTDLKIVAPFKVKRRQYRSQEVLPIDKSLYSNISVHVSQPMDPNVTSIQSENTINSNKSIPQVPILYDNQRAEIVASVTERLYSKLKKKEESAVAKMESMVDKKIMEPLSELRICTNARQRLVDLSHKALRNKRRIGIPAHSQTRKLVTRVRDQGVDVQTDLQPYYIKERDSYTLHQDVGTETVRLTPRCKEIAVGPRCGSVTYNDRSTTTGAIVQSKNCFVMTDDLIKCDNCTQTIMVPPPRRRKATLAKYLKSDIRRRSTLENAVTPVININISQSCPAESESHSDESVNNSTPKSSKKDKSVVTPMTPDLLSNHNATEVKDDDEFKTTPTSNYSMSLEEPSMTDNNSENKLRCEYVTDLNDKINEDFPDGECSLPRVRVSSLAISNPKDMEDMILSRNLNTYPYNILLSPPREIENTKRTVKFRDIDVNPLEPTKKKWNHQPKIKLDFDLSSSDKDIHSYKSDTGHELTSSDSTDSSKTDSDAFIWRSGPVVQHTKSLGDRETSHYSPVYKQNTNRYRTSKTKVYREFLSLDKETDHRFGESGYRENAEDNKKAQEDFRQKRQFFENKFEREYSDSFKRIERNIMRSCDKMELSVNKYDQYLAAYRQKNKYHSCNNESLQKPREYLHHLVKLRRQIVKEDSEHVETSTDSSHTQIVSGD